MTDDNFLDTLKKLVALCETEEFKERNKELRQLLSDKLKGDFQRLTEVVASLSGYDPVAIVLSLHSLDVEGKISRKYCVEDGGEVREFDSPDGVFSQNWSDNATIFSQVRTRDLD